MSETTEKTGRCLCGAIGVVAGKVGKNVGVCHCGMCRKWAGGPFMAVQCGTEVSFTGEENLSVFNSSEWADRGFCNQCGTPLFYRLKERQQYIIPVGLFDDDEGLVFDHQVFIDDKPSFYAFANKTKDMTGAEIFAKFTGSKG